MLNTYVLNQISHQLTFHHLSHLCCLSSLSPTSLTSAASLSSTQPIPLSVLFSCPHSNIRMIQLPLTSCVHNSLHLCDLLEVISHLIQHSCFLLHLTQAKIEQTSQNKIQSPYHEIKALHDLITHTSRTSPGPLLLLTVCGLFTSWFLKYSKCFPTFFFFCP